MVHLPLEFIPITYRDIIVVPMPCKITDHTLHIFCKIMVSGNWTPLLLSVQAPHKILVVTDKFKTMRKVISILLTISCLSYSYAIPEVHCYCGDFETGMYSYTVDSDCCQNTPSTYGTLDKFIKNESGTWILDVSIPISGQEAQNVCCPAT